MTLWPALARFARTIALPGKHGTLFCYDSAAREGGGFAPCDGFAAEGKAPVILIHGLGDEADSWRHLFPLLAKSRRVIALDLPGFGRSSSGKRPTLAFHAKAIRALLDETGPAVLVGSSMGAAVAELVAFEKPESVKALAFIDGGLPSAAGISLPLVASLIPFLGERGYRAYRKDGERAYRSLAPYYADLSGLPEADRGFLRSRVVARVASDSQLRSYFSSLRSFVRTAFFGSSGFRRKLARSAKPLLIVWGEADRMLSLDSRLPLLAARPDAFSVVIAGAGHLPHQERPEETAFAIEEFLASAAL